MFTRVAIATDNAGQGPIVTARDELRYCRATFFGHESRHFARYCLYGLGFCIFGHESPAGRCRVSTEQRYGSHAALGQNPVCRPHCSVCGPGRAVVEWGHPLSRLFFWSATVRSVPVVT
jgi:hypothetical protein